MLPGEDHWDRITTYIEGVLKEKQKEWYLILSELTQYVENECGSMENELPG